MNKLERIYDSFFNNSSLVTMSHNVRFLLILQEKFYVTIKSNNNCNLLIVITICELFSNLLLRIKRIFSRLLLRGAQQARKEE